MSDTDDHIDKSQWLRDDEPVVLPIRTDIRINYGERGGIEYYALTCRSIASWLYERDKINNDEFRALCDYQMWRNYTEAQISGRPSSCYHHALSGIRTEGYSSFLFTLLIRRLKRNDQKMIDHCVDGHENEYMRWIVERSLSSYQSAIQRLTHHVKLIRDTVELVCGKDEMTEAHARNITISLQKC